MGRRDSFLEEVPLQMTGGGGSDQELDNDETEYLLPQATDQTRRHNFERHGSTASPYMRNRTRRRNSSSFLKIVQFFVCGSVYHIFIIGMKSGIHFCWLNLFA
jgi:hypothetical protein